MTVIQAGTHRYDVDLVIFDKDGTLFDFKAMWAHIFDLQVDALRAELRVSNDPCRARGEKLLHDLFVSMGYDPVQGRVDPLGPLALATYDEIRVIMALVLYQHGWDWEAATNIIASVTARERWPPLQDLLMPLGDLAGLFASLTAAGIRIGIVTTDDRQMTQDMLALAGALPFVSAMSCADDGWPLKPAPDGILAVCQQVGVAPQRTMMVGDSPTDMLAARAAGLSARIGVTSGVSTHEALAPWAHVVLSSIQDLHLTRAAETPPE